MTNKPPYRFTSDDFISFYGEDTRQAIVRIANEKLAEWEAGSEKVWGKPGVFPWEASDTDCNTHVATVWNPVEIEKEEE